MNKPVERGQLIKLTFEGREFEVIVIDPNGLGKGLPSVGFGFRMMEKYGGLPEQTLSNWLTKESAFEGDPNNEVWELKPSPDNCCRVTQILGTDKNKYIVVEASDWVALVIGVLKNPGKVRKPTQGKLLDFLGWFAVKGFYADAYTALKGVYTAKDSRVLSAWMEARLMGKPKRNKYTDFLQEQGIQGQDYAYWTDYVYLGLFNMPAWQMKRVWEVKEGDSSIARNHILEVKGLEAVAYCEDMVERLFVNKDLKQAHDDAINYTRQKFFSDS